MGWPVVMLLVFAVVEASCEVAEVRSCVGSWMEAWQWGKQQSHQWSSII